jgi:hypothetical protein
MSVKYLCMASILSCLKIIGVDKDDLVIAAYDGRGTWRKEFSGAYKSPRKEQRDKSGVDWDKIWYDFKVLKDEIDIATNWAVIELPKIESDDIMAVACRYFKDRSVILCTYDEDLTQCWAYDNVQIFSPHPKSKCYKIKPKDFNPYQVIAKKTEKEVSDGLVSPIYTEEERQTRRMLVNLLELPEFVEQPIIDALSRINTEKSMDLNFLSSPKIRKTFEEIYLTNKKITVTDQLEKIRKKEERIKKRKEKERAKKEKERTKQLLKVQN